MVVDGVGLDVLVTAAAPSAAGAPTLVWLHEGLGSADLWRDVPSAVRDALGGPATVVWSREGHGRSDRLRAPRTPHYMHHEADVVLPDLLAQLDIERPVLVGHSDGGSIALLHAGAGHPVSALVLLAPHVFVEDLSVASIAATTQTYLDGDLARRMARHHDDADGMFRGWSDIWLSPEFRSWNIEDRLVAIDVPVLVIQGDEDQYGTMAQVDAIDAGCGGRVTRAVIAGAGHAPHLEAPGATLEAMVRFLRRVVAAG